MPRIGQAAERSLDIVPTMFVLEATLDQLGDKGAPPPGAGSLIELGYQFVVQCDMYAHGLTLAHIKAHLDHRQMTEVMGYRFTPPESRDSQTLHQVLARRVASRGEAPWIVGDERSWSYRDIDSMSNRIANGLGGMGIARGDTVLVMLPDCVGFIAAWCGLAKLGAVQVPVNTHLRGNVLLHVLSDSRARTVIVHAQFLDRIAAVTPGSVESLIVLGEMPDEWPEALAHLESSPFGALLDAPDTPVPDGPAATDLVAVLYTSGTTGPSKGVMISHIQAYEYARSVVELLELAPDDVYYAPLPLFHIAGQWGVAYAACLVGARAVLARPFSAGAYWADMRRYRATATFLLGAMASFLFQQPEADDDADNPLERALVVPLLPEIEAFKRRFGCLVSTTWGATEFNVPTRSTFDLASHRTCGRVAGDRYEVRIVDELDREVPPGVPGEAVVRPREPWLTMIGYWGRPDWTVAAWRNLWLHTGDMLMRDEEGNFYFIDRTRDAIRRRGENISSMEVEQEIVAHPDVVECAVIPVASKHTEQEVMAVVAPRPGATLDPVDLIEFLAPRMAYFMVPRYVEVVSALPKTQTGKVRKYALRERGLTSGTWDREAAGIRLRR